jgi:hypothetical protein
VKRLDPRLIPPRQGSLGIGRIGSKLDIFNRSGSAPLKQEANMSRKHPLSLVSAVLFLTLFSTACMDSTGPNSGSDSNLPGTWVPGQTTSPAGGGQTSGISNSPGPRTTGISTSPGPHH